VTLLAGLSYVIDHGYVFFNYEDETQIISVIPGEGHISGNVYVDLIGNFEKFYNDAFDLYFGTQLITDIPVKEKDLLTLKVPPVGAPQTVEISIVYDGVTYSNDTVNYQYKTYSDLTTVSPLLGPTKGGSFIQVIGTNFDDTVFCKIDKQVVLPILISKNLLFCVTPPHKAGSVLFELDFNGGVY